MSFTSVTRNSALPGGEKIGARQNWRRQNWRRKNLARFLQKYAEKIGKIFFENGPEKIGKIFLEAKTQKIPIFSGRRPENFEKFGPKARKFWIFAQKTRKKLAGFLQKYAEIFGKISSRQFFPRQFYPPPIFSPPGRMLGKIKFRKVRDYRRQRHLFHPLLD